MVSVLDYVGNGSLTWLTNISDTDSNYESENNSNHSGSSADNVANGSKSGAKGRDAHRNEDDLRGTRRNRQQDPLNGLPVPSTISRKDISAADSIDLQMLAEKRNELALAGQDNEWDPPGRRSLNPRLGVRRSSTINDIDDGTNDDDAALASVGRGGPPRPGPPPPPPPANFGSRQPPPPPPPGHPQTQNPSASRSLHPPDSLLRQIAPSSTLQSLFVKNWSNPHVAEPYMWRDRLRITGRRKSDSSLDHQREVANSPSLYPNLPPDISKRKMLSSWKRRVHGAVQTNEPNFDSKQIFLNF